MQRATRDTFWDIHPLVEHTEYTIWEWKQSWSLQMLWWVSKLCSETHLENTLLVQEKTLEVEDPIPDDYVRKYSNEELLLLNDIVSIPPSSEPPTPIHETQQEQREPSPSLEQNGTSTFLVKDPSSKVKLNHPITNILGSLNDNMRLRSKALNVITHLCYLSQFEPKKGGWSTSRC